MIFGDESNYYELLEVPIDATNQQIREAYSRAKSAYKKDSVALYTLMSSEETQQLLKRIEDAFQILSDPERRRQYDRSHGILQMEESNIISIDRFPPMEDDEEDLLIAPSTDFTSPPADGEDPFISASAKRRERHVEPPPFMSSSATLETPTVPVMEAGPAGDESVAYSPTAELPKPESMRSSPLFSDHGLQKQIEDENEWRGSFIRQIREARHVSLEELADSTKISKTYLTAIEEENFGKLPARVFLRGFVIQVAKVLRLPHDRVANAYIERYDRSSRNQ